VYKRQGKEVWKGKIESLKRVKDDVREVAQGFECGILLDGFSDFQEGDVLEASQQVEVATD
jgi:translation initiation factor IF-2